MSKNKPRSRKPAPGKIIQEIEIHPEAKYILLCEGLQDKRVVALQQILMKFFEDDSMPFFILNVDGEHSVKFKRVDS